MVVRLDCDDIVDHQNRTDENTCSAYLYTNVLPELDCLLSPTLGGSIPPKFSSDGFVALISGDLSWSISISAPSDSKENKIKFF